MTVRIAHASIDERGKAAGGAAGDQTGREVCVRAWYSKPWQYVIRCKDTGMRENIAYAMERAADNNAIGYDQGQRNTLLTYARKVSYDPGKVTAKCETDCSALVSLACIYAGIPESALVVGGNSATTSTIRNRLKQTGKFDVYSTSNYLSCSDYLLRGDILLKEGSHIVVVIDNGAKAAAAASVSANTASTSKLKVTSNIKSIQTWLNTYYQTELAIDGSYGPKTKIALVKAWQTEVGGLTADGIFGTKSKSAAASHVIKKGASGILVTIWQAYLVCRGYNPNGIDGSFGAGCHNSTVAFQKANSLTQDGTVGQSTWRKAFA
ncbi:MAG: peptidoglycan-binding protein [Lachnospiraceae bacterium]|nr:peptidoglycan-binding protein [Lachnospiraceae bacterium]